MRKKLEITERELGRFVGYLRREEREDSTIESYLRAARQFAAWLDGRVVTKELAAAWKAQLLEQGYRPVSVNAMLAAVNKLLVCMGREDCKVRYLKLQRQMFRKSERELTRAEYQRLLDAAQARATYGSCSCWKLFAPQVSVSASCNTSPWRRRETAWRKLL